MCVCTSVVFPREACSLVPIFFPLRLVRVTFRARSFPRLRAIRFLPSCPAATRLSTMRPAGIEPRVKRCLCNLTWRTVFPLNETIRANAFFTCSRKRNVEDFASSFSFFVARYVDIHVNSNETSIIVSDKINNVSSFRRRNDRERAEGSAARNNERNFPRNFKRILIKARLDPIKSFSRWNDAKRSSMGNFTLTTQLSL